MFALKIIFIILLTVPLVLVSLKLVVNLIDSVIEIKNRS